MVEVEVVILGMYLVECLGEFVGGVFVGVEKEGVVGVCVDFGEWF